MLKNHFFETGVTDSKAVKGSKSTLDLSTSTPTSLLVVITGVAGGILVTGLIICFLVTCQRKVLNTRIPIKILLFNFESIS
jgi:hypothetical protein